MKKFPHDMKCRKAGLNMLILIMIIQPWACSRDTLPFDRAMVTFRFDDAYASQLESCRLIASLGMTATVYCIAGRTGQAPYMTQAELEQLAAMELEIGSHSMTHPYLPLLGRAAHEYQTVQSAKSLRGRGLPVSSFAYPYGLYSLFFDNQVRENYSSAATYPLLTRGSLNSAKTSPYRIDCIESPENNDLGLLLEETIAGRFWLVLSFHRIGNEKGKYITSPERAAEIIGTVYGFAREGKLDVVTISEGAEKLRQGQNRL